MKAYAILYMGRMLQTLEGYGTGVWLRGLLQEFWDKLEIVTR